MVGKYAIVKGKILSYSSNLDIGKDKILIKAEDKTRATVRLFNKDGVHKDDILFIINNKNLVMARIKVKTIFKSGSFGKLLIGYGNLRLGGQNQRVVQLLRDSKSENAYIYKSRGDYFNRIGETGKAIREYRKAINLDRWFPDAHLELGLIYYDQGLYQYAFKEFSVGYKKINRIYDNWDKFRLLKGMLDIRYKEVFDFDMPKASKDRYRKEAIKLGYEALKLHQNSLHVHYYLGKFHLNKSEKIAKDHFLKVTSINPDHKKSVTANILLARLYYSHDNITKAKKFAREALRIEPYNQRARRLLNLFQETKRPIFIK